MMNGTGPPALPAAPLSDAVSCQFRFVMALPQRGHSVLPPAQVVPQLLHWLSREGFTGFTGPQA